MKRNNQHQTLTFLLTLILAIHQFTTILQAASHDGNGGRQEDSFIKTRGVHFLLNGSPFYAHGFNAYWLMYMASEPSQRYLVTNAFKEASSRGLTVARTWAFNDGGDRALQSSPGSYNEQAFQGMDFAVAEARKYGIKMILSFVNNYDNFGGKKQYVNWARTQGGQNLNSDDEFFTNDVVKGYYKNHIQTLLNRQNSISGVLYKNDPTIMAWELMNEPRCQSDTSGRTIQAWITEMTAHVKSIDRNHLLEVGLEGFYGSSTPQRASTTNPDINVGTDFIANNQIPGIDFATIHAYPDQWLTSSDEQSQLSFMNTWLDAHIEDAGTILKKPLLLAEFGKSQKAPGFSTTQRDTLYTTVYSKLYSSAKSGGPASGGLFWQLLTEGMDSFKDGYEIILSESSSTVNLISDQSRKMYEIRRMYVRMRDVELVKKAKAIRWSLNRRSGGGGGD